MPTLEILFIVFISSAILIYLPFGLSALLYKIFAKRNGLNKLIAAYSTNPISSELIIEKQSFGIGKVRYRNSTDICILPEGFYFWIKSFLSKYDPILIPWNKLSNPQSKILALKNAMELTIDNPPITTIRIHKVIYDQMKPYLEEIKN